MAKITFEGIADLKKGLKDNVSLDRVKRIVKHNGAELQRQMKYNADFYEGYQTGATKRSIGLEITDGGMTAEVGPETEYSPYLEFGTRFMEAQPFIKPAWEEQKEKFISDMDKIMR